MRTLSAPGTPVPPEVLFWDAPVTLHGESLAPTDDAHARGFLLRLHADAACPVRLSPDSALVAKRYEEVRAEALCMACALDLVPMAQSSVARRLREAERTLLSLREHAEDEPLPREIVHCIALRYEASTATSVHPEVPELAALVAELATDTADVLRDALEAYHTRRAGSGSASGQR